MQRRSFVAGLAAAGLLPAAPSFAQADPLPSWNDGQVKQAILDFMPRVTIVGGSDFVPAPERIATFDNDGTLWTEQPNYFQIIFAMDRVRAMAAQHPEWRTTEPFRSVLAGDRAALAAMGEKGMLEIMAATHASIGPIPILSSSQCWNCWPSCGPTSSRPSSSRAAASSSCDRGPSASTASR